MLRPLHRCNFHEDRQFSWNFASKFYEVLTFFQMSDRSNCIYLELWSYNCITTLLWSKTFTIKFGRNMSNQSDFIEYDFFNYWKRSHSSNHGGAELQFSTVLRPVNFWHFSFQTIVTHIKHWMILFNNHQRNKQLVHNIGPWKYSKCWESIIRVASQCSTS